MSRLTGRIALVTGCLGGIGAQISRRLVEAGASVIGTDLARADAGWTREIGAARYERLDVSSEAQWAGVAQRVAENEGRLDVLVHNAGVVAINPIAETPLAEWRGVMAVNVDGPFLGTKACISLLKTAGANLPYGASVVMISSVTGLVGSRFSAAYGTSKGAVRLFAKAAAVEFAALGQRIRVNSVHPGLVETPMVDRIMARYVEAGFYPTVEEGVRRTTRAMGRMAAPDDIAKVVCFLASDDAGHMNGSEVVVDGGFTAA